MSQNNIRRFAITRELLTALSKASAVQKQAFAVFLNGFRMGKPFDYLPLVGASEYERIEISDDFSVIIKRNSEIHVLLWLGNLADVKQWANTHKCEVNSVTGSLQIYQVAATPTKATPLPTHDGVAIFEKLSDEELLSIGLPQEMLPKVRCLTSQAGLEAMQSNLPENVYEALTWYAQGEDWQQIKEAYTDAYSDEKTVVPTTIGKLDTGRFHIVTGDEDLRSVMDKPLAQWRVFLHPLQKRIVDNAWRGAVLVTGGAGTGKTVAAIHRARHLVQLPDWKDTDKLLFTTFTKNLALDLEQLLKQICTRKEMKRIQVQNIDAWLATFIRQHGADKTIVYPGEKGGVYETCWDNAWASFDQPQGMNQPESFYRSEFEEVILPQHCMSNRDYILADRKGRGKILSRLQRKAIWPLFEDMRLQLQLQDAMTVEDAALFAVQEIEKNHPNGLYRAVIADEIQDFKPDMLKLLRALATDIKKLDQPMEGDLFLAGDSHQRIYGRPVSFSSCGIEVRGRSRKLRLNYRTTDEIRKVADAIYEGTTVDNMDGDSEKITGYAALRHGAYPETHLAKTFTDEIEWIVDRIKTLCASNYVSQDICIVVRTNDLATTYAQALKTHCIDVRSISRNRPDDPDIKGVRIATMHRVKGLEFKVVFVAGLEQENFFIPTSQEDPVLAKAKLSQEKALFYVAASRASDLLFLSAVNQENSLFESVLKNFSKTI